MTNNISAVNGMQDRNVDRDPYSYDPLKTPTPIGEQCWADEVLPLVSICCPTFNHEDYIEECIKGFLLQETTFPVEIIVRDDCSADGTVEKILKYSETYPKLFRVICETENQRSKGVGAMPTVIGLSRGRYIALCEGDDYWILKSKLETQIAFMEQNPGCSLTFTDRQVISTDGYNFTSYPEDVYTTADVMNGFIAFTQTVVMRNFKDLPAFLNNNAGCGNGDLRIGYFCSLFGTLNRVQITSAVYRRTGSGVWSQYSRDEQLAKATRDQLRFCGRFGGMEERTILRRRSRNYSEMFVRAKGFRKRMELVSEWRQTGASWPSVVIDLVGYYALRARRLAGRVAKRVKLTKGESRAR